MNTFLEEGTNVLFVSGIGYRNGKGEVRYDVKAGAKGVIKKAKLSDGKPVYDVELLIGKTLQNERVVSNVSPTMLCKAQLDIIKSVDTFPKKPKKNRPWRKFETEQLEAYAVANGIEWKRNENPRVNRMFLVKALDDSGLEAPADIEELMERIS